MPKKTDRQEYFIKGKDIITDPDAPTIEGEFVDNSRPEGKYQGATLEVHSQTHLESDLGMGKPYIMRTYQFKTDPSLLYQVRMGKVTFPTHQEIFASHLKGIAGMLWGDGLTPAIEIEPVLTFTPDRASYLIMVWATPSLGQSLLDKPQTLSQIVHGNKQNSDEVHGSVQLPPTKKKKASRTA